MKCEPNRLGEAGSHDATLVLSDISGTRCVPHLHPLPKVLPRRHPYPSRVPQPSRPNHIQFQVMWRGILVLLPGSGQANEEPVIVNTINPDFLHQGTISLTLLSALKPDFRF